MTSVMKEKGGEERARVHQFTGLLRAGAVIAVISIPALVTGVVEKNLAVEAAGMFGTIVGGIFSGQNLIFRGERQSPKKV
ncbi:MAG: hypothetical protein KGH71_03105 [Candidatus Micrarchaeota archaeon]|nr:hypothetical protein [Candidatus Micrarchaeota archaeon]